MTRVMGLDLGSAKGGMVILSPGGQFGHIVHWKRLSRLSLAGLRAVVSHAVETFEVGLIAIERPFIGGHARVTKSQHERAGVVETICQERGLRFVTYAPATVKKAMTGNGRATKEQMQRAAYQVLMFAAPDEHTADAAALAAVALSREGGG